jgi:hypothetical protein
VAKVEVDEVLRLCAPLDTLTRSLNQRRRTMGDEASKVPADDAVPRGALATVELLTSK